MHSNFEVESRYFTFWNETTLILDGWTWTGAGGRPELREVVVVVVVGGGGGGVTATAAAVVVVCDNNLAV